ncbi:uncharacterized protein LOC133883421 [Phragmites australis]|uniref:uncharacterized protein LOC133883421 n=1 Tax=Phragmites australis TaxID=29695 RepID=UPI002D797EA7|nr:uncharacterized protein LOC133883421 [Phragmites australis]
MAGGHRLQRSGSTSSNGTPPHDQEVFPAQGDQGAGPISAAAAGVLSDPQQMVGAPAARFASGSRRAPPRRRLAFSEASPGSALLAAQALLRHPPIRATPNTPEGRWMQDIAALAIGILLALLLTLLATAVIGEGDVVASSAGRANTTDTEPPGGRLNVWARKWWRFPATEGLVWGSAKRVPNSSDPLHTADVSIRVIRACLRGVSGVTSDAFFGCRMWHRVKAREN